MIAPIGADRIAGKIAEQGAKEQLDKPQELGGDAQARFRDAMQGGERPPQGETAVQGVQPTDAATRAPEQPAPEAASPGDSILNGIDKMRTGFKTAEANVQSAINSPGPLSAQDLLTAQMQLAKAQVDVGFEASAVAKVEQGVNSLVKGS